MFNKISFRQLQTNNYLFNYTEIYMYVCDFSKYIFSMDWHHYISLVNKKINYEKIFRNFDKNEYETKIYLLMLQVEVVSAKLNDRYLC